LPRDQKRYLAVGYDGGYYSDIFSTENDDLTLISESPANDGSPSDVSFPSSWSDDRYAVYFVLFNSETR
jgi:hypothetical protein